MTQHLAGGYLLVSPADVVLLAELARLGAVDAGQRRKLPSRTADLLGLALDAARAAGSARNLAAGQAAAPRSSSDRTHWITTEEAAGVLKTSTSYVRRLCRSGQLRAQRHGPAWLVDEAAAVARANRGTR